MMNKFKTCLHSGGEECMRYGGDGCTIHKSSYIHPFSVDAERPFVEKISKGTKVTYVPQLEGEFSETSADLLYFSGEFLQKALYHFDLETVDGIDRLLELLPILSDDILTEVYTEIWPGYPTDDEDVFNLRIARAEVKGYLMDFILKNNVNSGTEG